MSRLGRLTLPGIALLLVGCGIGDNEAGTSRLCAVLGRDLAGGGLSAIPTQEQARVVGGRLDARVRQPAAPALHDAVIRLHQRLHALEAAHRRGDDADVRRLARQARNDAADAARACDVPVTRFTA